MLGFFKKKEIVQFNIDESVKELLDSIVCISPKSNLWFVQSNKVYLKTGFIQINSPVIDYKLLIRQYNDEYWILTGSGINITVKKDNPLFEALGKHIGGIISSNREKSLKSLIKDLKDI